MICTEAVQHRNTLIGGVGRDADITGKIGVGQELASASCGRSQETVEVSQAADVQDVADIALQIGALVGGIPEVRVEVGTGMKLRPATFGQISPFGNIRCARRQFAK